MNRLILSFGMSKLRSYQIPILMFIFSALFCIGFSKIILLSYDNKNCHKVKEVIREVKADKGLNTEEIHEIQKDDEIYSIIPDTALFLMMLILAYIVFQISSIYYKLFLGQRSYKSFFNFILWALVISTFMLGALDLAWEIFGAEDIKHLYYFLLALFLFFWLFFQQDSSKPRIFFGIGLLVHLDYLLSEFLPYDSVLYLLMRRITVFFMDKCIKNNANIYFDLLALDVENIFNKNFIALFYFLSFVLIYRSIKGRLKLKQR